MGRQFYWAGWDDEKKEDVYVNADTSRAISNDDNGGYWPFQPGQPNGGRLQNCAAVLPQTNKWFDLACDSKWYGFCHINARPRFKLRGK